MKVLAIIQARMKSERLPKKVLKKLGDSTILDWVYHRTKNVKLINQVVVATTLNCEDDIIYKHCLKNNYECYRGEELNVLKRFYDCLKIYNGDVIVRVTSDDPFKDTYIIETAINTLIKDDLDYCSNTIKPTFPEGLDVEVFTKEALAETYLNASKSYELEHVTPYIWENAKKFRVKNIFYKQNLSDWRLTIDYQDDLTLARKIVKEGKFNTRVNLKKIIKIIKGNKKLLLLCKKSSHIRNEGYFKSKEIEYNE